MGKPQRIYSAGYEMKRLLVQFDTEYFLNAHLTETESKYSNEEIAIVQQSYADALNSLTKKYSKNKKQEFLKIEGVVRKMYDGGMLLSAFGLDNRSKSLTIHKGQFAEYGEEFAYFELWRRKQKDKFIRNDFWKWLTRAGAVVAFILSAIKIAEIFK